MGLIRIVASLFAFTIVANGQSNYGGIAGIFNQHPGLKISHDGQGVQYSYSADHMVPQPAPKSAAPQTVSFPSTYSSGSQQPAYQPTAYQPSSYQQQQPAYQPTAYRPGAAYHTSAPSSYEDNTYNAGLLSKESPIFGTATKLFGENSAILGPGFQGAAQPVAPQTSSYQPYSGASRPTYYSGAPAVSVAQHNPYQSSSLQTAQPQISPQEALQLHNQQLEAHQKQVQAQEQLIASFAKQLGLDQAPQPQPQQQGYQSQQGYQPQQGYQSQQGHQPQQAQYQQYRPQTQSQYGYSPQYASQAAPSYKSSYQRK